MKKKYQGFTLIELLVVVAIIGLLSTLSILALNTARARARDAKRVADVKQIQTALEMYFNDVGAYPSVVTTTQPIANGASVFLRAVPAPPTPIDGTVCASLAAIQPDYTYVYTPTSGLGGTYTIKYCLGAAVNSIAAGMNTATPAGIY